MDRRTFLLLAAATVGTSGCTNSSPGPRPNPSAPGTPADPDAAIRRRVAESEAALIAAYRAAVARTPALATTFEPILRQHSIHLARVAPDWTPPEPQAPSPTPAGTGSPTGGTALPQPAPSSPAGTASPPATDSADPADLLSGLAAAELVARDHRIAACDAAVNPALARELCLIGASEAQHAAVLADAAREDAP